MPGIGQQQPAFQFGLFEYNSRTRELRKNGVKLRLQEQPLTILLLLLERPGEIVTPDDIQNRLWPENTYVDFDNAINSAVRKLRDALGDDADNPRFVETLPRRGYRFIAPVSSDLGKQLRPESLSLASSSLRPITEQRISATETGRSGRLPVPILLMIAVAGLAVLTIGVLLRRPDRSSQAALHIRPLTSNTGLELQPSFSPDGTRVAYAWSMPERKQSAIYVKLDGPGDAVKMTKDLPRVFSPAWSPDGRWIAALQDLGHLGVIILIPAAGGQFKQLAHITKGDAGDDACVTSGFPFLCGAVSFASALAWSPDGKYLFTTATTVTGTPPGIVRISAETGEVRPVTSPPRGTQSDFGPAISPDGRQLAFGRFISIKTGDLYVIQLSNESGVPSQAPKRITTDAADVMTPVWTPDSRELIFSSDRDGRRGLWRIKATGGTPSRITGIGEESLDVAISQNGRTLVYNHGHYSGSLWKIPISGGKGGAPVRVTATTARGKYSHFSPDGKRIAFQSGRSGVDEIWVCDADGTNALQLTNFGRRMSGSPRWSPYGRFIAFDSNVAGSFDIYAIPAGGGRPLQLTSNPATDAIPAWSRDGAWIYFTSSRTGRAEVWKVRATGGSETQVTKDGGGLGVESVDGRYLYFVRDDSGALWRIPVNGGRAIKVLNSVSERMYTVFRNGIYFASGSPDTELRYLDFATGSVHTIAPLPGMPYADVSADERWALYPAPTMSDTNLMVVENFR